MTAHFRRKFDFYFSYMKIAWVHAMPWKYLQETWILFLCLFVCLLAANERVRFFGSLFTLSEELWAFCANVNKLHDTAWARLEPFTIGKPTNLCYGSHKFGLNAFILRYSCQKLELVFTFEILCEISPTKYYNHSVIKCVTELKLYHNIWNILIDSFHFKFMATELILGNFRIHIFNIANTFTSVFCTFSNANK